MTILENILSCLGHAYAWALIYRKHDQICPSDNQYRESKIGKLITESFAASRKIVYHKTGARLPGFHIIAPLAVLSKWLRFNFPLLFSYNLPIAHTLCPAANVEIIWKPGFGKLVKKVFFK